MLHEAAAALLEYIRKMIGYRQRARIPGYYPTDGGRVTKGGALWNRRVER